MYSTVWHAPISSSEMSYLTASTGESPEELVNWLVRNEDSRPQMGMGPGEKAWWTGARWESVMRNARQEGATTRAQEAEKAFAEWSKDIGGAGLVLRSLSDSSSTGATPAKSSSRMKGDWAGPDAVSRLFTDPCTMEMVLDTRSALPVYNTVLRKVHSVAMVKSTGGLITARFWLACRTFLQVGFTLPSRSDFSSAGHRSSMSRRDTDSLRRNSTSKLQLISIRRVAQRL